MLIPGLLSSITSEASTFAQVQTVVILLVITLIVALISRRLRLVYTLVLVVVGLLIGFLPILSHVHLDPDLVLFLFLPALLFDGAWNVEVEKLLANWLPVVLLAVPGLVISLVLVAAVVHWGIGLPWLLALLLGAMVSPTDPVAVLSLMSQLGVADRLRTIVEGESLFNDGTGITAFEIVLLLLIPSLGATVLGTNTSWWAVLIDTIWLMFGGLALGIFVGWVTARFLRHVNDHLIEITVTFSVAYGVYLIGTALDTSGLLAVWTPEGPVRAGTRGRSRYLGIHRLSCQLLTLSPAGHRNWLNEPGTILPRDLVGTARSCGWPRTDGLHAHTLAGCFSSQIGTSQGEASSFFTRTPSYPQDMASTAGPLWSTWCTLHCPGTRPARHPGPAKLHRRYSLWCRADNPARTGPGA